MCLFGEFHPKRISVLLRNIALSPHKSSLHTYKAYLEGRENDGCRPFHGLDRKHPGESEQ